MLSSRMKEPLFGVFYILSEGTSHRPVSRWELRWGLCRYIIDFGQVVTKYNIVFKHILNAIYQVARSLITARYVV